MKMHPCQCGHLYSRHKNRAGKLGSLGHCRDAECFCQAYVADLPPEGMKRCTRCKELKLLEAFRLTDYVGKDGNRRYDSWCKRCTADKSIERWNAVLKHDPEDRKRRAEKERKRTLAKYSMTLEDYDSMLEAQNGVCLICSEPPEEEKLLFVDHCHVTGQTRKLLCHTCNLMLGYAHDDPKLLLRAVDYLEGLL